MMQRQKVNYLRAFVHRNGYVKVKQARPKDTVGRAHEASVGNKRIISRPARQAFRRASLGVLYHLAVPIKKLLVVGCLVLLALQQMAAQTDFELKPSQCMLMTGKGPGQDATINPYEGQNCYAVVENIGKNEFSVRIQKKGEILETISVRKGEVKKVILPKGYELYLDTVSEATSKARVTYEQIDP